jgi:subtilisin
MWWYLPPKILPRELKSLARILKTTTITTASSRLVIAFIIAIMIISSFMVIFINPALAVGTTDPTSIIAFPSIIGQDDETYPVSIYSDGDDDDDEDNTNRSPSPSSASPALSSYISSSSAARNMIELPRSLDTSSSSEVIINNDSGDINDQYIVVLTPGVTAAERLALTEEIRIRSLSHNEDNRGETSQSLRILHEYNHVLVGFAMSISADNLDLVKMIQRDPRVSFVEKDQLVYASVQTLPTGINRADGDLSSSESGNGQGSVNADIAILDTGVDLDHPDLNIFEQRTFVSGTSSADDDNGHGTHVAGTAAAKDNSIGVVGTAPGARIWATKVLDSTGTGSISDIIAAIDYLTENSDEVDVGNMSFGCRCESSALDTAINNSVAEGITYVAAAGNDASDASNFSPANNPNVIAVSAIVDTDGKCGGDGSSTSAGDDDSFADFSNFGSTIDIAAPGVLIESTYIDGSYTTMSGTSMAAPHVAGAGTLYKSIDPTASPSAVRDGLLSTGSMPSTVCDGNGHGYFTVDPDDFHEPLLYMKEQSGAVINFLTARPSNNIVNTNTFYDVVFLTATSGAIKTIEVTFPAGTTIPSGAFFNEAEKCVPGSDCTIVTGTASKSGQTITYTITNAVNVPAGTKIRLEFANINNPLHVSASYKVTVTTRDASNNIIDGPTQSNAYTIKQIGKNVIADGHITSTKPAESFMKKVILPDNAAGNTLGWNPDGSTTTFVISEPLAGDPSDFGSSAIINVDDHVSTDPLCNAGQVFGGVISVVCATAPTDGSDLNYTIMNLPPNVVS